MLYVSSSSRVLFDERTRLIWQTHEKEGGAACLHWQKWRIERLFLSSQGVQPLSVSTMHSIFPRITTILAQAPTSVNDRDRILPLIKLLKMLKLWQNIEDFVF